jgi:hypothetical protein
MPAPAGVQSRKVTYSDQRLEWILPLHCREASETWNASNLEFSLKKLKMVFDVF